MDMETELRGTCHFARVNDIIFPADCSDLFITCSVADIRVWNATLRQELLRIQVVYLVLSASASRAGSCPVRTTTKNAIYVYLRASTRDKLFRVFLVVGVYVVRRRGCESAVLSLCTGGVGNKPMLPLERFLD